MAVSPTHAASAALHVAKEEPAEPFGSVGIALVLGFAFMMLVDQCSRSRSSRDVESTSYPPKRSFTATLGLVVHAAGTLHIFIIHLLILYVENCNWDTNLKLVLVPNTVISNVFPVTSEEYMCLRLL